MADVTLRFYGRFVLTQRLVRGKPRGAATFLAFRYKPPFRQHHVLMSVPRDMVSTRTKPAPTLRLMAAGNPLVTEHFAWDLSGCDVTPVARAASPLKLPGGSLTIADLADLEQREGRTAALDRKNLHASPRGHVSAAIKVSGGKVKLSQLDAEITDFVPIDKRKPALLSGQTLADVIDVKVKLPAGKQELRIRLKNGRRTSSVIVQTINASRVPSVKGRATVTFTNLCSEIPKDEKFDLEFGQFYELLQKPRSLTSGAGTSRKNRLIPHPVPHLGRVGDCNDGAMIGH
jgi:hypothetical protein